MATKDEIFALLLMNQPYLASILLRRPTRESDKTAIASCTSSFQIIYNPAAFEPLSPRQGAAVFLHEVLHLGLEHFSRLREEDLPPIEAALAMLAKELEINSIVKQIYPLPLDPPVPEKFGLEDGLLAEEYFELLRQRLDSKGEGPQADSGSGKKEKRNQRKPDPVEAGSEMLEEHGSGAGASRKPWEEGEEETGDRPSKAELEAIVKGLAESIMQQPGKIPAGLRRWAERRLVKRVPWEKLLRAAVSEIVAEAASALTDFSWRVPDRTAFGRSEVILPGMVTTVPDVAIIVDTSSSMDQAKLDAAMGVVAQALRRFGPSLVVTGDVVPAWAKKVTSERQVELIGGGGTEMANLIEAVHADAIVVVTDGFTDWPEKPVRGKVVAVLLDKESADPPPWIRAWRMPNA